MSFTLSRRHQFKCNTNIDRYQRLLPRRCFRKPSITTPNHALCKHGIVYNVSYYGLAELSFKGSKAEQECVADNCSGYSNILHGKFQNAERVIRQKAPVHSRLKLLMKALDFRVAPSSKNGTDITIVATRPVKRNVSLESLMETTMHMKSDNNATLLSKASKRLKDFHSTSLKLFKKCNGKEHVVWNLSYVPLFDGSNVRIVQSALEGLEETGSSQNASGYSRDKQSDFSFDVFCRFLHVLADMRRKGAKQILMESINREKLNTAVVDP